VESEGRGKGEGEFWFGYDVVARRSSTGEWKAGPMSPSLSPPLSHPSLPSRPCSRGAVALCCARRRQRGSAASGHPDGYEPTTGGQRDQGRWRSLIDCARYRSRRRLISAAVSAGAAGRVRWRWRLAPDGAPYGGLEPGDEWRVADGAALPYLLPAPPCPRPLANYGG